MFSSDLFSHPLNSIVDHLDVNKTMNELKEKSLEEVSRPETDEDGISSEKNDDPQADAVKETEDDPNKLSTFELSVVRCCSSNTDDNFGRCFEVNGFGGVNFAVKPCQYLKNVTSKLEMD